MLIFLSIAVAAFVVLAGAFMFGHDHDAGGAVDHGIDHGDAVTEHTVSIFSTKVICTFAMGFGGVGAIARHYECSYPVSSLYGVIAGVVLGLVMYGFLSLISKQQSSSLVPTNSLVGASGTVTVSIESSSLGEVGVSAAGQYMNFTAKSANGQSLPRGATVRVVSTVGSELVVEKA